MCAWPDLVAAMDMPLALWFSLLHHFSVLPSCMGQQSAEGRKPLSGPRAFSLLGITTQLVG